MGTVVGNFTMNGKPNSFFTDPNSTIGGSQTQLTSKQRTTQAFKSPLKSSSRSLTLSKKLKRKDKNNDSSRPSMAVSLSKKVRKGEKHQAGKNSLNKQPSQSNLHRRVFSNKDDDSEISRENFNQVVVLEKSPYDNGVDCRQINNQTDVGTSSRYQQLEESLDRKINASE